MSAYARSALLFTRGRSNFENTPSAGQITSLPSKPPSKQKLIRTSVSNTSTTRINNRAEDNMTNMQQQRNPEKHQTNPNSNRVLPPIAPGGHQGVLPSRANVMHKAAENTPHILDDYNPRPPQTIDHLPMSQSSRSGSGAEDLYGMSQLTMSQFSGTHGSSGTTCTLTSSQNPVLSRTRPFERNNAFFEPSADPRINHLGHESNLKQHVGPPYRPQQMTSESKSIQQAPLKTPCRPSSNKPWMSSLLTNTITRAKHLLGTPRPIPSNKLKSSHDKEEKFNGAFKSLTESTSNHHNAASNSAVSVDGTSQIKMQDLLTRMEKREQDTQKQIEMFQKCITHMHEIDTSIASLSTRVEKKLDQIQGNLHQVDKRNKEVVERGVKKLSAHTEKLSKQWGEGVEQGFEKHNAHVESVSEQLKKENRTLAQDASELRSRLTQDIFSARDSILASLQGNISDCVAGVNVCAKRSLMNDLSLGDPKSTQASERTLDEHKLKQASPCSQHVPPNHRLKTKFSPSKKPSKDAPSSNKHLLSTADLVDGKDNKRFRSSSSISLALHDIRLDQETLEGNQDDAEGCLSQTLSRPPTISAPLTPPRKKKHPLNSQASVSSTFTPSQIQGIEGRITRSKAKGTRRTTRSQSRNLERPKKNSSIASTIASSGKILLAMMTPSKGKKRQIPSTIQRRDKRAKRSYPTTDTDNYGMSDKACITPSSEVSKPDQSSIKVRIISSGLEKDPVLHAGVAKKLSSFGLSSNPKDSLEFEATKEEGRPSIDGRGSSENRDCKTVVTVSPLPSAPKPKRKKESKRKRSYAKQKNKALEMDYDFLFGYSS